MENKKQLLFIPPMSGPLQKLNEVLVDIAEDEKIEISIIDDLRELMQFVGSTGQCLIAFSNAKKCATFLQDNRLLIARTHTKVILLTPKEIPVKTLSRFTKIGLTESILENSPPKTLLYKVKLLLRSIKSTGASEEKELTVKSMDANASKEAQAKSDLKLELLQNEEVAVNYLNEERAKYKKNDADLDSVNTLDHLKNKVAPQEETIETHWKSKRKNDENLPAEAEADLSKVETEEQADIDMYYRGIKKDRGLDVIETDEISKHKKQEQTEQEEGSSLLRKESLDLNLAPGEVEKRKSFIEEEENALKLKASQGSFDQKEAEEEPPLFAQNEEEAQEEKRRELMELEALFEEAQKRQSEESARDLGGHYKGKINNTNLDLEESEKEEERDEYDNSDLYSQKKSMNLDLLPGEEDTSTNNQGRPEDEEEEKERDGYGEKIGGILESEEGQTDHIETMMKSEMGLDRSKNIKTYDIQERQKPKSEDEVAPLESNLLDLGEKSADTEKRSEKKEKNEITEAEARKQSLDLDLSPALSEQNPKEHLDNKEDQSGSEKATKLNILDGDRDSNHGKSKAKEDEAFSYRKLEKQDDPEDKKKAQDSGNKTDKIDGFMRGGEARKTDQDWDLDERKSNFDLGLEKKKRAPDITQKKEVVDLGEQTIDYRKIKQEFDAISRGEEMGGVSAAEDAIGKIKEESEDDSFKVVEVETAGLDFAVEILNMINLKELRPEDFFKSISEELKNSYHAWPIFYSFTPSEKKHTEVYDSILKLSTEDDLRIWWMDHKKEESIWSETQSKSMATWICREMKWEDVEIPTWASNELMNKKVELIYPYFDGLDRMGLAVVYFPHGINPKQVRGIEVTLDLARTLFLETIQRKTMNGTFQDETEESSQEERSAQKKNIISVFSGLFGKKKKAG